MAVKNHIQAEVLAPLRVGVVDDLGTSDAFDEDKVRQYLLETFSKIKATEGHNVEIVAGWTWGGVSGLAYEIATAFDWNTVGVACGKVKNSECFPCDRVIIVGSEWGDESDQFLSSIDLLIKVGVDNPSLEPNSSPELKLDVPLVLHIPSHINSYQEDNGC
ncbi:MAG: hypothetical protein QNJ46_35680 [Leptolyngbyaceae cyanobacterium MO_188.B28]|nr:hypothetical protein [Leptolyngbyaceae cyanobacterium MO_188.B28]